MRPGLRTGGIVLAALIAASILMAVVRAGVGAVSGTACSDKSISPITR